MSKIFVSLACLAMPAVLSVFYAYELPKQRVSWPGVASISRSSGHEQIKSGTGKLDIPFIANHGQLDDRVKFFAQTFGGMVFIDENGAIVYSLSRPRKDMGLDGHDRRLSGQAFTWLRPERTTTKSDDTNISLAFKEQLSGGTIGEIKGEGSTRARTSYFKGKDPAHWRSSIPSYEFIDFGEVYQGIELKLRAYSNNVEKLFFVEPGANPGRIRIRLDGLGPPEVNRAGELEICTEFGPVCFTKPVAYQEKTGERTYVDVAYTVNGEEYGFNVGDYDRDHALVIDPLLASTFLGGSDRDGYLEVPMALGEDGSVYVASRTKSLDFPTTLGSYDETHNGGVNDVFVSKFNNDLSVLLASTFLGGSDYDGVWPGVALTVDQSGNLYVAGRTVSSDFPTTPGAYNDLINGGYDVFVSRLSSDLDTLLASTYLGGTGNEYYITLTSDENRNVYVSGSTSDASFPTTTGAFDRTFNGGGGGPYPGDLFISRLDSNLTTLLASTFLGGGSYEYCEAIKLDGSGNVFLTGWTASANFPTTPEAYDGTHDGGIYDAFISKLDENLTTLSTSTFLGGGDWDFGYYLTLDQNQNVYVTGHTASTDFPTTSGAYDESFNGNSDDIFVSKLDNNLTTLSASTFLGGAVWECGFSLAVGEDGRVYVAGLTSSANFPTTPGAYDNTYNGGVEHEGDVVISKFDGNLSTLLASTFLGGSEQDNLGSMVVDGSLNVYVAGCTNSSDFPTTAGAYDESHNGSGVEEPGHDDRGGDVYITKLDLEWAFKDVDGDGILNGADNCYEISNPEQENSDGDALGDSCDNCPSSTNPGQDNNDGDEQGDACDDDDDNDTVLDVSDNCQFTPNPGQGDHDQDGIGDLCDDCDCGVEWGDVNDDGNVNPVDVVFMVNYVYLSSDMRVQPPVCVHEAGDVNCDGNVNPVDMVHFVNYVYLSITPFPCPDPCAL